MNSKKLISANGETVMVQADVIVVGAGIVGLASAYQIMKRAPQLKILVLEKESDVSQHQTGHNSGVIHSGIYYTPGSLKALNCRIGYELLLEFARAEGIPFEICGKIVVATLEEELPRLKNLFDRGVANGLEGLRMLSPEEIREIEPHCAGIQGVFVPQTGIIDYLVVSRKLKEKLEAGGHKVVFDQKVEGIERAADGSFRVRTQNSQYQTKKLVSCAGLQSDRVAKFTSSKLPLRIVPFRGEYFTIKKEKQSLVKHLIYPVPDPAFPFLGVHFTRMIDGGREAGPNAVLAFKREGYSKVSFNVRDAWETFTWPGFQRVAVKYWRMGFGEFYRSFSKRAFVRALQRLIPEIREEDLEEGGAGIRAQASARDGGLVDDFYFVEEPGIVHVCNAPSPAATASLAIGKAIAEKILAQR
jgi:L-2-hydroxyglutarate oxidase